MYQLLLNRNFTSLVANVRSFLNNKQLDSQYHLKQKRLAISFQINVKHQKNASQTWFINLPVMGVTPNTLVKQNAIREPVLLNIDKDREIVL